MTPASGVTTTFPALSADEAAHSARVRAAIDAALSRNEGWMPFSRYQQIVLYEPGLGYYSAGARKFGAGGDFVTAPEVSPLFTRVLARWIVPLLEACGPGARVLELGAGSGALARDLLGELRRLGRAPAAYEILEVSAALRARQREALATASDATPLRWLDRLPEAFSGVVIANEVLDALPCERFVRTARGLDALGVATGTDGALIDAPRDPSVVALRELPGAGRLAEQHAQFARGLAAAGIELPLGYGGEFIPGLAPFVRALAGSLQQGAIVLFDYGLPRRQLYLAERAMGSLRCIRRHHSHGDPYREPGLTDISCWVDFSAVAAAAQDAGLDLRGFATQAAWLLEAGLDTVLTEAMAGATDEAQRLRLAQGARTLLLPGEMGEAVKMMCLARQLPASCGTVLLQDLRRGL